MATKNTDFVRFNAYSIKDLITRKLSEDSNFTDQIYEGSNLAILIDIISYMYQCLIYNLNNAAAESMFSDTQLYENINRLVKFVGYNPKGCITANASFVVNTEDSWSNKCIMPYTCVDSGKFDSNGNAIFYSFLSPYYINGSGSYETILYNGRWKLYNTIFTASGTEYETFTLTGLESNTENNKYVAWPYIEVFVKHYDNKTNTYSYKKFSAVEDGLLLNQNNTVDLYNKNSRVFNIKLNENKQYEIKFGNGYNGELLEQNDQLLIFYLESNGSDGEINLGDIQDAQMQHSSSILGISQEIYENIFEEYLPNAFSAAELATLTIKNIANSTEFKEEESVDQIRENAPFYNRTNNRLVTYTDFEYYIKNIYSVNILDVKAQNNWDYVATFYKWLYTLSINNHGSSNGTYYLNENTLLKYGYKYADSCDSNNIYLWIKMKNSVEDNADQYFKTLDNELYNIKVLTSELVFMKPINVAFDLYCGTKDYYLTIIDGTNENDSYIEITISNNILYASDTIKQMVYEKIINFFLETNFSLGAYVNFNSLLKDIYAINGIENVRTVLKQDSDVTIVDGLSFASYSDTLMIDAGDDLEISNAYKKLECFQFPVFAKKDLLDHITVIKKNMNNLNDVVY